MNTPQKVILFDTTLRDGQQCPGAAISFEHNLTYAHLAAQAGIDVLEAGFPAASTLDFEIVTTICKELCGTPSSPTVAGLSQLRRDQVERTIEALMPAAPHKKGRLHIYLPVAADLMKASLGERADDYKGLLRDLNEFCRLATYAGLEVEYSPEGYSRAESNFDFTTDTIRAAIDGGARVINCPDTIGGACWVEGDSYFVSMMAHHAAIMAAEFPRINLTWSAHCHNDFGLALHNSLQAVFHGPCRQIEGCFNGIGERAGNVSLEQVIVAIDAFGARANPEQPFVTGAKLEKIQELSDFVAKWMLPRQPHWPITGENAAKHSSGGHTNAILKNPLAYQPFDPRRTGKEISFVFGPLSGGNHAQSIIQEAGYICEEHEKAEIAQHIKTLYETRRKGVTDEEVLRGYFDFRKPISVSTFGYGKRGDHSEIILTGRFFDEHGDYIDSSDGKDSALATLKKAIDRHISGLQILHFHSESIGTGISAQSHAEIVIADDCGRTFKGTGQDNDIEISAMKALIDGVNQAYVEKNYRTE
jgi:2-isopropylmalate synthase